MTVDINVAPVPSGSHRDLETRRSLFEELMQQVDIGYEKKSVALGALSIFANSAVDIEFLEHCMHADRGLRLKDLGYTAMPDVEIEYCPNTLPADWTELMPRSEFHAKEDEGDPSVVAWRESQVIIDPAELDKMY